MSRKRERSPSNAVAVSAISEARPSGCDDGDQMYDARDGEVLGVKGEFRIEEQLGQGRFARVFRCTFKGNGRSVAVKVMSSEAEARQSAEKERAISQWIQSQAEESDLECKRYLATLVRPESFEHRGHLCLVFEIARCDLRQGLHKYCRGGGFPLEASRIFAANIFKALSFLHRSGIIHTDLKPENLLLSNDKSHVKLADFGSTMHVKDCRGSAEVQPRFYRAPEVILGQQYGTQIDVWSAGVTLFEIMTGRLLFGSESIESMIHDMIQVLGAFPVDFTSAGNLASHYFHMDGQLRYVPTERAKSSKSLRALLELLPDAASETEAEARLDFLTSCLRPVQEERCTASAALEHGFLQKTKKERS